MRKNLLQRLMVPTGYENPFGGLDPLRGLDNEGKKELQKIVRFDYMGAIEYELGSIPKSLHKIFHKKDKELYTKEICGATFLVITSKSEIDLYVEKIKNWTTSNSDGHGEYSGLNDIISGKPPQNEMLIGWLDITDDVLFFRNTDEGIKMANTLLIALTPQEV